MHFDEVFINPQNNPQKPCKSCEFGNGADVLFWMAAISTWDEKGDKSPILNGLRFQRPIPPFARDFIADIIEGKAKRKPIIEKACIGRRNQFIRNGYKSIFAQLKAAKRNLIIQMLQPST